MQSLIMSSLHQAKFALILQKKTINFRLILVCLVAASVGLPIALIGIAKILLLIGGIGILLFRTKNPTVEGATITLRLTTPVVLLVIFAFTLSLLWTTGSPTEAYNSLAKYGKLLMIPLIVALIGKRTEAMYALGAFAIMQIFLLASSWMLYFHLPVPWATSSMALAYNSVFSSYLDQGIMTAVFAGICWHLRALTPGRFGQPVAIAVVMLALANVFFVLEGRSGHIVAIVLISLVIMWTLPVRLRAGVVLLPFLLLFILSVVSPQVQNRIALVKKEVQAFSFEKGESFNKGSSSGIRLNFWHRAVQSIADNPIKGSGVGSWSSEFNRLERYPNLEYQGIAPQGNPHQEYLLWGVQLGIPGLLLLFALVLSIYRDTAPMDKMVMRAAQSALAALVVACLFNSSIYDALIGDFFCVTLGLLMALGMFKTDGTAEASMENPIT